MTETTATRQVTHLWYARPVFFVADVDRALRFYIDMLGFVKLGILATGPGRSARRIAENGRDILAWYGSTENSKCWSNDRVVIDAVLDRLGSCRDSPQIDAVRAHLVAEATP